MIVANSNLGADIEERLMATDVGLLNDHNVSDATIMPLAAEHAARTEALLKLVDPTRGRAMFMMIAGHFLDAANQIAAATVQEPELMHV